MVTDPMEILDAELEALRREYTTQELTLRQIGAKIEALEAFRPKLAAALRVRGPGTEKTAAASHAGGRGVPVRALVRESLEGLPEFTSHELVAVVQEKNPQAREDSIRAELSRLKKAGQAVEMVDGDRFRSLLYHSSGLPTGNGAGSGNDELVRRVIDVFEARVLPETSASDEDDDPFAYEDRVPDGDPQQRDEAAYYDPFQNEGPEEQEDGPGPGFGRITPRL
jgi:hypothetical protein